MRKSHKEDEDFASLRDNVHLTHHFFEQLSRRGSDYNPLSPSVSSSTTPSPVPQSRQNSSDDNAKVPTFEQLGLSARRDAADDRAREDINAVIKRNVRLESSDPYSDDKIRLAPAHNKKLVLLPELRFRRNWDTFIMVLLLYTATVSVFIISFLGVIQVSSPWFWIERFIDVSLFIDIALNFFTAYEKNGVQVVEPKDIRKQYLKTWFVPDLVSAFPWDVISLAIENEEDGSLWFLLPRYLRLFRLLKLIRLAKVIRLKQRFTEFEIKLGLKYGHVRLTGLFVTVIFVAHWFGCLFYYFGIVTGAAEGWIEDFELTDGSLYDRYIAALYFSVYTITTIGYGDVTPGNTLERTYTTIIMFLGAALFAYVISQVSNVSGELNASSAQHRVMMDSLTDLAKYRQLPDVLVYEIRRYFQRDHLRQRVADEKNLLSQMNPELRIRVLKHMFGTHLEHSRFFKDIPKESLDSVYSSMTERLARRNEKVFSENEEPNGFFIILSGKVIVSKPGMRGVEKGYGEIVGEDDILFNRPRKSSATCTKYSELVFVPREAVMDVLRRYPYAVKRLRDEEAIWVWKNAIAVVEQQVRLAKMASSLLMKGEKHVLRSNPKTGRRIDISNTSSHLREGIKNSASQLALSVVTAPKQQRAHSAIDMHDDANAGMSDLNSEVGLEHGQAEAYRLEGEGSMMGNDGDTLTKEGLQRELDLKTKQVQRLESKLAEVQTRLGHILGSINGGIPSM